MKFSAHTFSRISKMKPARMASFMRGRLRAVSIAKGRK